MEGSFEKSETVEDRFSKWSFFGTTAPSAGASVPIRFGHRYNRLLSLERGSDMLMSRRCGGFYEIAGPLASEPNSLVTTSTYCDELSSASYIMYHLVGLKPQ